MMLTENPEHMELLCGRPGPFIQDATRGPISQISILKLGTKTISYSLADEYRD
jgi:hypothetical protein